MSGSVHSRSGWVSLLVLAAMLGGSACGDDDDDQNNNDSTLIEETACPPAANVGVATLDDAQIAAVLLAANEGEILTSQVAQNKATDQDVRRFADRMIAEHTAATQRLQALLQQQNMAANFNALSQQLTAEANQGIEILNTLEGEAFDRAYMDLQINLHAKVLFLMDSVLLRQIQDPALRQDATVARGYVQVHLQDALPIQVRLATTP
jgi:putative membrane protein